MLGLALLLPTIGAAQRADNAAQVPAQTLLVQGAWCGSSDSTIPAPEDGSMRARTYRNDYFGLSYSLSKHWTQRYTGPPPSDSGAYVLAQIEPTNQPHGAVSAHLLIAAQDLFFSALPASGAFESLSYMRDHLAAGYVIDRPPSHVTLAGHSFARLDYSSPVAALHWRILATDLRCHVVQFVFTSRSPQLLDELSGPLQDALTNSDPGGPACRKDYAIPSNRIAGDYPVLPGERFNPIPVRITIDTNGAVKHLHFLSAFPEQRLAITQAVSQWRFKPYLVEGRPVEVETGIVFGRECCSLATFAKADHRE